jgi:(p)ppGpp synthase/HD superfamily hydrolase
MSNLGKAIAIAAKAFEARTDKGGNPYMLHCLFVMDAVSGLGEEAMIAAVLHDLVEDTEWTIEGLTAEGFSHTITSNVNLLTHKHSMDYMGYVEELAVSPIAKAIKMADLRHNSDINRMKGLTDKDFDRLKKYHKAYAYLQTLVD